MANILQAALPYIAPVSGLVGLGQSIFGAIQNSNARRKQEQLLNTRLADIDAQMKTPYVDTPEAQAVLQTAKENSQAQALRDESRAALTGATHEAKLAARARANKDYTNTIRQVAAGANNYRNMLQKRRDSILDQQYNAQNLQADSGNNMIGSGLNVLSNTASVLAPATVKQNQQQP
jgi:hypothetical protein